MLSPDRMFSLTTAKKSIHDLFNRKLGSSGGV